MSLAARLDSNPPRSWLSAATYFRLSQACLSTEDINSDVTLDVVESLGLQSLFLLYHDGTAAPERAWITVGTAMKYAQAMGLHRDSRRWGLDEEVSQKVAAIILSLSNMLISSSVAEPSTSSGLSIYFCAYMGRPPSLNRSQVDCEMPADELYSFGQNPMFYRWKHQFGFTALLELATTVLSSPQPPDYSTVISLDKQLRAVPWLDKASSEPCRPMDPTQYPQLSVRWQEHAVYFMRTYALILLHRPFFARALIETTDDLFKHRFLRSVMTVHDSSRTFIRHILWLAANEPETLRMQPLWTLYMICSIVSLGALVVKAPKCSLTGPALTSLEEGIDFLRRHEQTSAASRTMLLRLLTAARTSMKDASGEEIDDPRSEASSPRTVEPPRGTHFTGKMEDVQFSSPHPPPLSISTGPLLLSHSRATSRDAFLTSGTRSTTPAPGPHANQQPPLWIFDDVMRVESQIDQSGPLHHALYVHNPSSRSSLPHSPLYSGMGHDAHIPLSYQLEPSPTSFQVPGLHDIPTTSDDPFHGQRIEDMDTRSWAQFLSSIGL
ncbi:hypothetical protein FRC17_003184 [Serendipita sp. 399]|nr:hypothetical protein FRC17_003184 [Serendipita sp. 399]